MTLKVTVTIYIHCYFSNSWAFLMQLQRFIKRHTLFSHSIEKIILWFSSLTKVDGEMTIFSFICRLSLIQPIKIKEIFYWFL